jgi:hypothetical protein
MDRAAWNAPTSPAEAAKRCGGRKRFNAERQEAARLRRHLVWQALWKDGRLFEKGVKATLAAKFGVSVSTIAADIKKLMAETRPCAHCGAPARLHRPRPGEPT